MEIIRYKYIIAIITLLQSNVRSENRTTNKTSLEHSTNCPITKLIEDVFKIHKKSLNSSNINDSAKVKWLVNTISNITNADENIYSHIQEEIVNSIIASINKIKENISSEEINNDGKLNEAIILNIPKSSDEIKANNNSEKDISLDTNKIKVGQIKSGIEEKLDIKPIDDTENLNQNKTILLNETNLKHPVQSTEKPKEYVEVLTIEPNNTSTNNSPTRNILDILKNLMPIFNSSITKDLHNITLIERDNNNNNSIKVNKNKTTIVVTFCDKDTSDITKADVTKEIDKDTVLKLPSKETDGDDDYYDDDDDDDGDYLNFEDDVPESLTISERKDVLEAAEYGMQKMHELYSVMEPKLYSMGLWLDSTNPARYVAAFNAPSEDAHKYSRYGYASLQAATRLKELVSGNEDALEGRTEEIQFPKASALRQSSLLQQCPLRGTPKCPPASKRYRTHDGTCNNLNRPRWGSTMTPVQRFIAPSYSDDLQAPRRSVFGTKLPSARQISSLVHESRNVENHGITHLLMQWGQFVDHDVTSTSQSRGFNGSVPRCCKDGGRDFVPKEFMHPECFPIAVPPSDPFYGPRGVRCLDFVRSSPAPRDDCALGWREQLNQVSAYIDGSPLYGSSARKSDNLRLFRNGMLQYGRLQQQRPLLPPERRDELCRGGAVSSDCFRSGDARVNEQPGLVATHIVWLRQHNRMAQELAHLNPHWSDEKIYQETRKIVGAMIQHITYKEFLPIVLGADVMELFELNPLKKGFFKDYNLKINPSPASSFGSAAFRFGHSLVQPSMMRYDRFHRPLQNNVSLHDELRNPSNIWSIGAVDRLLLGMINQPIQKRDEFITEELTNHLFQTPEFDFGMDLAAINIQRGRDHGIPPYTAWREPCGLSAITEFEDLFRVMPPRVVRKIQVLYKHVDDIDLFTGGMAERPVIGGLVGPTFACIIAQQFSNLRKGDRFWYENGNFDSSFTPAQLQQIRRISFAQVLCRTLDSIDSIQPFVFLSPDHPDNNRILCHDGLLNNFDLSPWIEINSDFDNDIRKSDDEFLFTADKTVNLTNDNTKPRTTTAKPKITTKKTDRLSFVSNNRDDDKKSPASFTKPPVITPILTSKPSATTEPNRTNNILNTTTDITTDKTLTKLNLTTQRIDDKLDFKNKSLRYDSDDRLDSRNKYNYRPTQPYTEYDEDEIQSVQSVVINNLNHQRPYHYNRPVISVTEKLDKFTYLINYVPKPTQSWRQTTRRPHDRDVVKVTYQTYDDTYRRPTNGYYYNRRDDETDDDKDVFEPNYRFNRPNTFMTNEDYLQSARSNNKLLTTATPRVTETDKTTSSTTDNWHKLITFGYVGTYKGHQTTSMTETDVTNEDKRVKSDSLSKDFSTDEHKNNNEDNEKPDSIKLSTFFLYDTATKPYFDRPIRRHDDKPMTNDFRPHKYYYIRNVLHKYNDATDEFNKKDNLKEHTSSTTEEAKIEDRSAGGMVDLDQIGPNKSNKLRVKKRPGPAKTPSVSFQVIPSENGPSNWAVYEENEELGESLHQMPSVINDPHALRELPRPLKLAPLKRRRPGRS